MTAYDIKLRGCDACTYIYDVELQPAELALLERLVDLADKAGAGGCQPSLLVQAAPIGPPAVGTGCANCYDLLGDVPVARDRYGEWIHRQCPDDEASQ